MGWLGDNAPRHAIAPDRQIILRHERGRLFGIPSILIQHRAHMLIQQFLRDIVFNRSPLDANERERFQYDSGKRAAGRRTLL